MIQNMPGVPRHRANVGPHTPPQVRHVRENYKKPCPACEPNAYALYGAKHRGVERIYQS